MIQWPYLVLMSGSVVSMAYALPMPAPFQYARPATGNPQSVSHHLFLLSTRWHLEFNHRADLSAVNMVAEKIADNFAKSV